MKQRCLRNSGPEQIVQKKNIICCSKPEIQWKEIKTESPVMNAFSTKVSAGTVCIMNNERDDDGP